MKIIVKHYNDMWQEIKDNALFTIHKDNGKYPTTNWKSSILRAEHSPIRSGRLIIECYDVPSFVIGHVVRHNIGFTAFVSTLRKDRVKYGETPDRNTLNNLRFDGNFQSFINISRRRLCKQASVETREFWKKVMEAVREVEPELYEVCVPECIYRGGCPEMKPCGMWNKFISKNISLNLLSVKVRYEMWHSMKEEI